MSSKIVATDKHKTTAELHALTNRDLYNEINASGGVNTLYLLNPPSWNGNCYKPKNYCKKHGGDFGVPHPFGCGGQTGCDADQICCCKH